MVTVTVMGYTSNRGVYPTWRASDMSMGDRASLKTLAEKYFAQWSACVRVRVYDASSDMLLFSLKRQ